MSVHFSVIRIKYWLDCWHCGYYPFHHLWDNLSYPSSRQVAQEKAVRGRGYCYGQPFVWGTYIRTRIKIHKNTYEKDLIYFITDQDKSWSV